MEDWAGPLGALIGFGVGWFQYEMVSGVVVAGLRRTDNSKTKAEFDDYERRIRLLQAVMVVVMMGGLPILGYVIGQTLFG